MQRLDIDVEGLRTERAVSRKFLAFVCVEAQGMGVLDHSVEEEACLR